MDGFVSLFETDFYDAARGYWIHRLICQLESDAEGAELLVTILDIQGYIELTEEAYCCYNDDSRNYEVTFKTWQELSDDTQSDILDHVCHLSYNFNEEGY